MCDCSGSVLEAKLHFGSTFQPQAKARWHLSRASRGVIHPSQRAISMGMGLPWMASLWRDTPPAVGQRVTQITETRNWQNPLCLPHKGWRVSLRLQSVVQYSSDSLDCLNRTLVSTGHKTKPKFAISPRKRM